MADDFAARIGEAPCKACGGDPTGTGGGKRYCLRCDRSSLDGRVTFPGLAVDERPDPDWHAGADAPRPARSGAGLGAYLHRVPAGK